MNILTESGENDFVAEAMNRISITKLYAIYFKPMEFWCNTLKYRVLFSPRTISYPKVRLSIVDFKRSMNSYVSSYKYGFIRIP